MQLLFHSLLKRAARGGGGGGVRLKLDAISQGGGMISDVDGQGDEGLEN